MVIVLKVSFGSPTFKRILLIVARPPRQPRAPVTANTGQHLRPPASSQTVPSPGPDKVPNPERTAPPRPAPGAPAPQHPEARGRGPGRSAKAQRHFGSSDSGGAAGLLPQHRSRGSHTRRSRTEATPPPPPRKLSRHEVETEKKRVKDPPHTHPHTGMSKPSRCRSAAAREQAC